MLGLAATVGDVSALAIHPPTHAVTEHGGAVLERFDNLGVAVGVLMMVVLPIALAGGVCRGRVGSDRAATDTTLKCRSGFM